MLGPVRCPVPFLVGVSAATYSMYLNWPGGVVSSGTPNEHCSASWPLPPSAEELELANPIAPSRG